MKTNLSVHLTLLERIGYVVELWTYIRYRLRPTENLAVAIRNLQFFLFDRTQNFHETASHQNVALCIAVYAMDGWCTFAADIAAQCVEKLQLISRFETILFNPLCMENSFLLHCKAWVLFTHRQTQIISTNYGAS